MRKFLGMNIQTPNHTFLEASSENQYIFATFPHGVNADFRILMDGMLSHVLMSFVLSNNIRVLAATVLFRIPIVRELALWTNCVDARRSVADSLLKHGRSLLILPGGQAEQIRTRRGKEMVYLKRRKGFIKLALKHDVEVVPVYVFGCSDYYNTSHAFIKFRLWLLKHFGICIPLASGAFHSLICPFPIQTTIVFGKPQTFQKTKNIADPTIEEVNTAHDQFMVALTNLFDEHKDRLGYGDRELEIL
jgi:2-acylglycerol O-acyltransferase 2